MKYLVKKFTVKIQKNKTTVYIEETQNNFSIYGRLRRNTE